MARVSSFRCESQRRRKPDTFSVFCEVRYWKDKESASAKYVGLQVFLIIISIASLAKDRGSELINEAFSMTTGGAALSLSSNSISHLSAARSIFPLPPCSIHGSVSDC